MAAAAPMPVPIGVHQTTARVNGDATSGMISRWSDLHISNPALVSAPSCEHDIISAIRTAKEKNLSIVVGGGGHGTFMPVDSSTLYIDMKAFQSIDLDKEAGVVRVGGGVATREVLKRLTDNGVYTPVCDSNAVGTVGSLLGGGNSPHNGIRGYMVDSAVAFRVVTANEETVDVDASSTGEKLALFNALCGAGQGWGVIVSATMKVYPLAGLQLSENKIWTRVMIFPPPALETAVKAYLSLKPVAGPLYTQLVFNRAPPGTPMAGSPIIVLSAMYLGPAKDAELAASVLFASDLSNSALQIDSQLIDITSINNALEPVNVHGGLKSTNGARLTKLTAEMITPTFNKWLSVTNALPDAQRSLVSFQTFNTEVLQANGNSAPGKDKFLESRDRPFIMVVATWCTSKESQAKLVPYVDDVLAAVRKEDGAPARTIPNTMRYKEPLKNLFTEDRIAELHRLKKCWDPTEVFWSPYVGAYRDA